MASASDVPGRFDVVINGQGYRVLDSIQASASFHIQRSTYGYSPTFVERANVQGDYGDNQQDFWLTVSDRDWALGEQQHYYRSDQVGSRRYFRGTAVDVTVPGQVTNSRNSPTVGVAAEVIYAVCTGASATQVGFATAANLYTLDGSAAKTSKGAHGLSANPGTVVCDDNNYYVSADGATKVRRYNINGAAWSDFSATSAGSLAYLNNTLYGLKGTTGVLYRYATDGTATSIATWKDSVGTAWSVANSQLLAYGGKLLILVARGSGTISTELWQYDGVGVSQLATFPSDFNGTHLARFGDMVFVAGTRGRSDGGAASLIRRPAVYTYVSGSVEMLWQADDWYGSNVNLALDIVQYRNGAVWYDPYRNVLLYYDSSTGGISAVAPTLGAGTSPLLANAGAYVFVADSLFSGNGGYIWPTNTIAATGTITTSLFDFDSMLSKYIKGITIDADLPTGSSIDIAYFTNTIPYSSTTNVQTGAVAGTEYAIGVSARSIGFLVTLNKGSSAAGPTLKRIYVRAAPILQSFRRCEYLLDLSGRNGDQMLKLRDGSTHAKDGLQMAKDINTATVATTPFSITDRFGTYTGILEPDQTEIREIRPEEFAGRVVARQT